MHLQESFGNFLFAVALITLLTQCVETYYCDDNLCTTEQVREREREIISNRFF